MSFAVVAIAAGFAVGAGAVAAGVATVATVVMIATIVSVIGIGLTVVGMVTGNKLLGKIGGIVSAAGAGAGMGAGFAGWAGLGASATSTGASAAGQTADIGSKAIGEATGQGIASATTDSGSAAIGAATGQGAAAAAPVGAAPQAAGTLTVNPALAGAPAAPAPAAAGVVNPGTSFASGAAQNAANTPIPESGFMSFIKSSGGGILANTGIQAIGYAGKGLMTAKMGDAKEKAEKAALAEKQREFEIERNYPQNRNSANPGMLNFGRRSNYQHSTTAVDPTVDDPTV